MRKSNLITKIALGLCFSLLFLLAKFFGKGVTYFDIVFFSLGVLGGIVLLELDEKYLYKYYQDQPEHLITRSLLFVLAMMPLGLFLLTSTGSSIGVGIFLGIISSLSLELFKLKNDLQGFKNRFMHQLKREVTVQDQQIFTIATISSTILYSFFVIFR